MPVEINGEVGAPGAEREWFVAECKLANGGPTCCRSY
jgi:hypothetical protein